MAICSSSTRAHSTENKLHRRNGAFPLRLPRPWSCSYTNVHPATSNASTAMQYSLASSAALLYLTGYITQGAKIPPAYGGSDSADVWMDVWLKGTSECKQVTIQVIGDNDSIDKMTKRLREDAFVSQILDHPNALPLYGIPFGSTLKGIPHLHPFYKFLQPSMGSMLSSIARPSSDWHQDFTSLFTTLRSQFRPTYSPLPTLPTTSAPLNYTQSTGFFSNAKNLDVRHGTFNETNTGHVGDINIHIHRPRSEIKFVRLILLIALTVTVLYPAD